MGIRTIYCVQTFAGARGRQEKGRLTQFAAETDALELAGAMRDRVAGLIVYRVSGEPEFDWWDEPVVLERHGRVPVQFG